MVVQKASVCLVEDYSGGWSLLDKSGCFELKKEEELAVFLFCVEIFLVFWFFFS
jgi:hypothetical protein